MLIKIGGVSVHFGFAAAVFFACALNTDKWDVYAIGFAGILLHELTHLFFMALFGCRHFRFELLPGGVRLSSEEAEALGYRETMVVLLSAPVVNLLSGGVLWGCGRLALSFLLREAAAIHLTLGLANLLPLRFLDGGRAMEMYLLDRYSDAAMLKITKLADAICLILLTVSAVILTLRKTYLFSFYVFFQYCLFMTVISAKKN
ncbi:MAG: hypothetical protein IJK98_08295 [Clostridia bacterium]|nr:hypothetical protein [Clostridia bacterium]